MNLINCPGCKKGIWIQGDEDSIECPLCGKRLRIQKKSIKKHNAQVSEIDVYKKLLLQERKKKEESILSHKLTWVWLFCMLIVWILPEEIAGASAAMLLLIGVVGIIYREIQRKPEERKKSIKQLLWVLVVLFFIVCFALIRSFYLD